MAELGYRNDYTVRPMPPYSFVLTARKPAGWALFTPFEIFEDGTLWSALHIRGRLVGIKAKSIGTVNRPRVKMGIFLKERPSAAELESIKKELNSRMGFGQDLRDFYRMAKGDRILKNVVPDVYGMHDTDMGDVFDGALIAITLQMAPMKRSGEMMNCLISTYGDAAEFEGRRIMAWPTPKSISKHTPKELARSCKLGYRAKNIVALSKVLAGGDFPGIDDLRSMSPEEAKERLLDLPGIGDYSADMMNPHGGFPVDVWSADVFGKLFFGREPRNGRDAVERIKKEGIRRWGKWAWMSFYYVVQDLKNLSDKLGISLRLT